MLLLSHQIEQSNDLITISISLINHPDQLEPSIQHNHLRCSDGPKLTSGICSNDENMIEIAVVIVRRCQKCAYSYQRQIIKRMARLSGLDPTRRLVYCLVVSTLVLFISPHLGARNSHLKGNISIACICGLRWRIVREQLQVCCLAGEIMGTICYILSTLTVVILRRPSEL